MIVDKSQIDEFPFTGKFYRPTVSRTNGLLSAQETKTLVLETECDIQPGKTAEFESTTYSIYFPIDFETGVTVQVDDVFEGTMAGVSVNGVVSNLCPSQLGGCVAYLKDFDA